MAPTRLAVMFSGGTDSTYAALTQIPRYTQTHLVTFRRHGFFRIRNVEEPVKRLGRAFPYRRIRHHVVDFEDIYRQATPLAEKQAVQQAVLNLEIVPLWQDPHGAIEGKNKYEADRQRLFKANECLQCKTAMLIAALRFCLENGITALCDGSNPEQLDDGSQLEDVKSLIGAFFQRYGVHYFSPAFHADAEERNQLLYYAKITDHLDHKKLEKTHQIPSRQVQCSVPAAVLWTVCIFPWLVYDGESCNDYIKLCCQYVENLMEKGLREIVGVPAGPAGPLARAPVF